VGVLQYAALAEAGYFKVEDLKHTKEIGSFLQGHPDVLKTPGIEAGTGSLGQGLSIGLGMSIGQKLRNIDAKTYVLIGDGEIAEGQIWEAAMAASVYKADNLVAIVDRNRLQANGPVKKRFDSGDIRAKFMSFGWNTIEIDGHDFREILSALDAADNVKGVPTVIIANTTKGKGISFAENVVSFHNGILSQEQYDQAIAELEA
jgi:transketolase